MGIRGQDIDVYHPVRGIQMPLLTHEAAPAVCDNCDAHVRKLSRLTVRTRSGKRINLALCAFCYLQLAPRARTGRAR